MNSPYSAGNLDGLTILQLPCNQVTPCTIIVLGAA